MKYLLAFLIALIPFDQYGQLSFEKEWFEGYARYREVRLDRLRFKHQVLQPLILQIAQKEGFQVTQVGQSIEGRSISMISVGKGEVDILLRSQMHGDEPTATMAIFDLMNFIADKGTFQTQKVELFNKVRLHFIPMVNPDGAEAFRRHNALGIDLNRDALRLQTPEARALKLVRDSLNAEFGFNLHDQSRYYNPEGSAKPATLSFLAPAYDPEKEVNQVRSRAMKVIALMNDMLQNFIPGQVGRYSDEFEPRAFGDNFQKWGTSTILVESGGQFGDPEKQEIRKLNFVTLLSAIFAISNQEYQAQTIEDYEKIPRNDGNLFDLKIENLTYGFSGSDYIVDLGIIREPVDNAGHDDYHYVGRITEIGDLSTHYGYQTLDASGLQYKPASTAGNTVHFNELSEVDFVSLLGQGFTDLRVDSIPEGLDHSPVPMNITSSGETVSANPELGNNATFLLTRRNDVVLVVVNGFIYNPENPVVTIKNGVVR